MLFSMQYVKYFGEDGPHLHKSTACASSALPRAVLLAKRTWVVFGRCCWRCCWRGAVVVGITLSCELLNFWLFIQFHVKAVSTNTFWIIPHLKPGCEPTVCSSAPRMPFSPAMSLYPLSLSSAQLLATDAWHFFQEMFVLNCDRIACCWLTGTWGL